MPEILERLLPMYDTLSYVVSVNSSIGVYNSEDLAVWKFLTILDCRLCQVMTDALVQVPRSDSPINLYETYADMLYMIEDARDLCMYSLGFDCNGYDFFDEMDYGQLSDDDDERTLQIVNSIVNGDVFGADTKYLASVTDFVRYMGGCYDLNFVDIRLYKSAWLGKLLTEAEEQSMETETYYAKLRQALDGAFGANGVADGQAEYGVCDGIFYAYLTMFDADDISESVTWREMSPLMVRYAYEAVYWAKQLEQELKRTEIG